MIMLRRDLRDLNQKIDKALQHVEIAMTAQQAMLMLAIVEAGEGRASFRDIWHITASDRSSCSTMLRQLAVRGYIKFAGGSDRRTKNVIFTKAGHALLPHIRKAFALAIKQPKVEAAA